MPGLYIHIPFCRQVCYYCDFHFSASLKYKSEMICALRRELSLQKDYLPDAKFDTIYFGGGTPSVLSNEEISLLLSDIYRNYSILDNAEITIEVNPDDINEHYLNHLKKSGFNRISIGIQSFYDDDLVCLNRRHSGEDARNAINVAGQAGFDYINADIIYGFDGMDCEKLKQNLETLFESGITHFSAYHIGIDRGSVFYVWLKKGKINEIEEGESIKQYELLIDMAKNEGFDHYEISNFASYGHYSRHNSSYWKNMPYLGVGPSAHSFNGTSRQWNTDVNKHYTESIEKNIIPAEKEIIDEATSYNDYILTGLRTKWGVSLKFMKERYSESLIQYFMNSVSGLIKENKIAQINIDNYIIPEASWPLSNYIICKLIYSK